MGLTKPNDVARTGIENTFDEPQTINDNLEVAGFTKLGGDSLPVKTKIIQGTTPGLDETSLYNTGIAREKIVSLNVLVRDTANRLILPNHGIQNTATEYYFAIIMASGQLNIHLPAESTLVPDCPFVAFITYIE